MFAYNLPIGLPCPCPCALLVDLPSIDGHVACRASQLEGTRWGVLAQNCKNVPRPSEASVAEEVVQAERDIRRQLDKIGTVRLFGTLIGKPRGELSVRVEQGVVQILRGTALERSFPVSRLNGLHVNFHRWCVCSNHGRDK